MKYAVIARVLLRYLVTLSAGWAIWGDSDAASFLLSPDVVLIVSGCIAMIVEGATSYVENKED